MSIFERRRKALAEKINGTIDVVTFAASLDPTEWNQGEQAYSPEFQQLIHEAKALVEAEGNAEQNFMQVSLDGGRVWADMDNEVRIQLTIPAEGDGETAPTGYVLQFNFTYEGLIFDLLDGSPDSGGDSIATSSQTYHEIIEKHTSN